MINQLKSEQLRQLDAISQGPNKPGHDRPLITREKKEVLEIALQNQPTDIFLSQEDILNNDVTIQGKDRKLKNIQFLDETLCIDFQPSIPKPKSIHWYKESEMKKEFKAPP